MLTTEEATKYLSTPEKRGEKFKHGSTRSVFFIPNDTSLNVQATRKRADWKDILKKNIKASSIGKTYKMSKNGVEGKIAFVDPISYKQWIKKKKENLNKE